MGVSRACMAVVAALLVLSGSGALAEDSQKIQQHSSLLARLDEVLEAFQSFLLDKTSVNSCWQKAFTAVPADDPAAILKIAEGQVRGKPGSCLGPWTDVAVSAETREYISPDTDEPLSRKEVTSKRSSYFPNVKDDEDLRQTLPAQRSGGLRGTSKGKQAASVAVGGASKKVPEVKKAPKKENKKRRQGKGNRKIKNRRPRADVDEAVF